MLTPLILVAVVILFVNITLFSLFWYETANSDHRKRLHHLSQGKTKRWILFGICSGCVSMSLVLVTSPLILWRKLWKPSFDPTCTRPTVILVHGLYHNASAWLLYVWRLRIAGYHNYSAWNYSSWNTSFDKLSQRLISEIRKTISAGSSSKLILIGHSLGGLLIRSCLGEPEIAEHVAAVVTLGSPHQGSKLAALAIGKLGQSLLYQGELIQQLNTAPDYGREIPSMALFSPVDNMVLPNEALRIERDNWIEEYTAPLSHVSLLYHWPTFNRVLSFLKSAN